MTIVVAKVNARWKKGCLLAFVGVLWAFHLVTATWFATHSEPVDAEVLHRKDWMLPGKRHGWSKLEVTYADLQGKPVTGNIEWHVNPAPPGQKIQIWRAESGLIKAGPASLAETFFVETLFGYLFVYVFAFIGFAIGFLRLKQRLRGQAPPKP